MPEKDFHLVGKQGYTEELGRYIVTEVENGATLSDVADYIGVKKNTISTWAARGQELGGKPFKEVLQEAKLMRAEGLMEEMLQEARRLPDEVREMAENGQHKIANAYVSAKARQFGMNQWILERLLPEQYGDKVVHQGKIDHGIQIQIVNYADMPGDRTLTVDGEVVTPKEFEHELRVIDVADGGREEDVGTKPISTDPRGD